MTIDQAKTDLINKDLWGRVTNGHMVVNGNLFPISKALPGDLFSARRHPIGRRGHIKSDFDILFSSRSDLWLLPVMSGSSYGQRITYIGLVLKPTGKRKDDLPEYCRFGTFKVDDQPGLGPWGDETSFHIVFDHTGLWNALIVIV
jgi:hypothetical protein